MARETLLDFFCDFAVARGEFVVSYDGYRTRRYGYGDVARAARGFAARLQAAGILPGDRIVLWGGNSAEWLAAFWGCLLAGGVVVPVDERASGGFASRVCATVRPRLLLRGGETRLDDPAGGTEPPGAALVWRLSEIDWADSRLPREVAVSPDDPAEILFTSGATAEPKGVVITHRNVLANIGPVEEAVPRYRRWLRPFFPLRFLDLIPLSHMFGQAMAAFLPPLLPGTVVFVRRQSPGEVVRQIRRLQVSVVVCVPKFLSVLREHVLRLVPESVLAMEREDPVLRRWWKYRRVHRLFGPKFWSFVVGGAPLDPALEEFWARLGFLVIQGYGLTETAPIVSLNLPFEAERGSVGKPLAGTEVKIAPDGEILVRGGNVSPGYWRVPAEDAGSLRDGWLHTGDVGELDAEGRLYVRGRKKEMIVTPEGLNVFPEDVERALNEDPCVRESAVVALATRGEERPHAVLAIEPGTDPEAVVGRANARLEEHQRIRSFSIWPERDLPRTEGTRKLRRGEIRQWVAAGRLAGPAAEPPATVEGILARYAGGRMLGRGTKLEELGLSSLERMELLSALEERFEVRIDESRFAEARDVEGIRALIESAAAGGAPVPQTIPFPAWNRAAPARAIRRPGLAVILPLVRLFARIRVEGREHLHAAGWPVLLASNHLSDLDVPAILAAIPSRRRTRVTPAMAKEFFEPHFFPERHGWRRRLTNSLNYYLAALLLGGFPLPRREAGAQQALRYMGEAVSDGFSVLIFPEGSRSEDGVIRPFRAGVGMIASRLELPVVPVRLEGLEHVLRRGWKWPRRGGVRVAFGPSLRLIGNDYSGLATRVEQAVRAL